MIPFKVLVLILRVNFEQRYVISSSTPCCFNIRLTRKNNRLTIILRRKSGTNNWNMHLKCMQVVGNKLWRSSSFGLFLLLHQSFLPKSFGVVPQCLYLGYFTSKSMTYLDNKMNLGSSRIWTVKEYHRTQLNCNSTLN